MVAKPTARNVGGECARKLRIAAAVAREALLDVHVVRALELVELGRGRVDPIRILEIYRRLHHLDETLMQSVSNRVLAILGEQALETVMAPIEEKPDTDEIQRLPARTVKGRLRALFVGGRVHFGLRRQVILHTGRTETTLMQVHAEHALRFADILEAEARPEEAVTIYREMLGVRESLHEALYFLMLSRMSQREAGVQAASGEPTSGEKLDAELARGLAIFQ